MRVPIPTKAGIRLILAGLGVLLIFLGSTNLLSLLVSLPSVVILVSLDYIGATGAIIGGSVLLFTAPTL